VSVRRKSSASPFRDEGGDLAERGTEPIADAPVANVGAVPQRDDSAQEGDPDHRVPRQLLGEDERGAEPVAEDDLHHDGQGHHVIPTRVSISRIRVTRRTSVRMATC